MKSSMSMAFVAVAMLLAQPIIGMEVNTNSELTFDEEGAKTRPVAKVIKLLKDMLSQLEKEAEEDQEVYDKFACWCETYDKEKTKAIKDAEARIESLTALIEELTAKSAQLGTEIKNLEKEIAKNQEALDAATEMRTKQLAEFQDEEKDMLGAISALKSAVTVLSKHNSASAMLQVKMSTSEMQIITSKIQKLMEQHADMLKHTLTHSERKAVAAFFQAKDSYAPQSGEIFGILSQMKETFESNLSVSQKEEMTNEKAFQDLKAAKDEEITSGQEMLDEKTQELATTDEKNAESKEDLEDTKNTLSADEQFLMSLKEQCGMMDAEWNERVKTRNLEMEACSKALAVLNSDDAHDMFAKTLNFVQTESAAASKRRTAAANVISAIAKKEHNPKLIALSYQIKLDAFTKVKKAINDMIADLAAEQKAEVKHKDFCVDEFNTNQLQTEQKDTQKEDLTAKIEDLANTIKSLTSAIATLTSEVTQLQVEMKRAGEDREIQNKEFQETVADQRTTQKLLQKALEILEGFYGKKAAAFVQGSQPAGPPPPPGFKQYKKQSGGVLVMIQGIIEEAKALEAEAIKGEEDSQKAYEDFVKETNFSIEAKTKDKINKTEEKSKAEEAKVEKEKELEATVLELEQLADYKSQLHHSCDFTMKNFEIRQTARMEEMEALKQALAILSGAKFDAFLQDEN